MDGLRLMLAVVTGAVISFYYGDVVERAVTPVAQPFTAAFMAARSTPYRNCAEARAAGAAPVLRGQPGYAPWLDRDHDGIGCEPRP